MRIAAGAKRMLISTQLTQDRSKIFLKMRRKMRSHLRRRKQESRTSRERNSRRKLSNISHHSSLSSSTTILLVSASLISDFNKKGINMFFAKES